jgi:hypothetical protein
MRRLVFCLSMQRSGTTSVGDWLEAHGLSRAGWPASDKAGWTRQWMDGDYEAVFQSAQFRAAEVFEDAPWWVPGACRILAPRFPEARFILLERDPGAWFRSMCLHSGGRNPGETDLHCRAYRREHELEALRQAGKDVRRMNQLDITDHAAHYQRIYRQHTLDTLEYFRSQPHRLYTGHLEDPSVFVRMRDFLGLPADPSIPSPRSNVSGAARQAALDAYLETRRQSGSQGTIHV